MKQVVADQSCLEFARATTHGQLILDPVFARVLLPRHQDAWLDVFATEIDDTLVSLQVHDSPL